MADTSRVEAFQLPAPLPLEPLIHRSKPPLGALLLRDGVVTPEQLERALAEKEETGNRLGELVVALGYAPAASVAQALAEQHQLEYLDLEAIEIEAEAVKLLPEQLAERYAALPIRLEGETLLIAVADPTNVVASDDLRLALGLPVRIAVAAAPALKRVQQQAYRTHLHVAEPELELAGPPEQQLDDDIRDGGGAPAIKLANQLIVRALEEGASDVHFCPAPDGLIVRARIDGVMRHIAEVPKRLAPAVTSRLKIMGELDIADRRSPQDGRVSIRYAGAPMDLRIAVLPTTYGEQIVLRIMHRSSGSIGIHELGMEASAEADFSRAIRQPYGVVITCGPTGSGKTTTLYAALDALNDPDRALTTIEDPVERHIPGVNQIEVNTRAGMTFGRGLRTILRSDPDVLLVGEIRDEETARIAIQAAMTGHLVLTSLHTHNAAGSIARLKDMGVEPGLLATSLNCIVAQRLTRKLCVQCREPYEASPVELIEMGAEQQLTLYRAKGCGRCSGTGYSGRAALYEVMPIQGKIRRLIEASTEEIFAAAVEGGMHTLREDGIRLCREGISSLDEIRRVTGDRMV
jgi:type IV pilus assembly protein PilB